MEVIARESVSASAGHVEEDCVRHRGQRLQKVRTREKSGEIEREKGRK